MTKFGLKTGVQGHIYFPKELRKIVGAKPEAVANAFTVTLFDVEANSDDVIESMEIVLQDLKLRAKSKKREIALHSHSKNVDPEEIVPPAGSTPHAVKNGEHVNDTEPS